MTQEVDEATGEIRGGQEMTAAQLEAMLRGLYELNRKGSDIARAYTTGSKPVREWLEAHAGERLRDGEVGIYALLQPSQGTDTLDVMTMAEKRPDLLVWMASHGCLKLNKKPWDGIKGQAIEALDVKGFIHKEGGTPSLIIDKEK